MMRSPRFLPSLAIASVLLTPLLSITSVRAQEAPATNPATQPATPETPAAPPVVIPKELMQSADDFWHYASIARYDLAKAEADKILSSSNAPQDVLNAFEAVVASRNQGVPLERRVELYERLLSWQRVGDLKEPSAKLIAVFNKAKQARAADPAFIEENIQRLVHGRRAYLLAIEQLKQSGELAVPVMLSYLRDSARKDLNVPIRSALVDLGYRALNPLVAATEIKDWNTLPWVISALGDLGYDVAIPYLVRLVKSNETPDTVKSAARRALLRLNVPDPDPLDPAHLFYMLAERFYYEKCSIAPAKGNPVAFMWFLTDTGLNKKDVPAAIFNEHMALRCCEYVLKLDGSRGDALSLWLAAAYKREVEIPEGASDPVWDDKHPDAHFYAVDSGARHLIPVLARALHDRNPAVALKAIKSLQQIVGSSSLFTADESTPLIDAMHYADRLVRFEAAFTIAQSLPQRSFAGQEYVVPILAEAVAQTGKPGVIVLASSQEELNHRLEAVGKAGPYSAKGGVGADAAVLAASALSSADVILMHEKSSDQIDRIFAQASQSVRLERAAKLIIVTSKVASSYAPIALNDPLVTLTDAKDEAALGAAIEEARKRAGGLPLDEKVATAYALRSAELLARLASSRGQILDLILAQNAVLAAIDDARADIVKAAAAVLALTDSKEAQSALVTKGLEDKAADDLKVSAFKNLAINAKFFSNKLDPSQIEALMKFVEAAQNPEVRAAAAEALGALNITSDQARTLILNQSKL